MKVFDRNLTLAILALSPLAALAAGKACHDDDFSGPGLEAPWILVDADNETGGSAQVVGGKLALSGRGSDVYQDVNEFVGIRGAMAEGNFDVSVKIESQSHTHPWAQAGIMAANDIGDLSKGGYVVVDVTPENAYNAFRDSGGGMGTLDAHVNAGVSGYPVWIRLARKGKKFTAWYKNQANAPWIAIAEDFTTQGTGPSSQIALVSLSHNDAVAATTVFDDFTCRKGTGRDRKSGKAFAPVRGKSSHGFDAVGRLRSKAKGR